jgi:hypothetical protein
MASTAQLVTTSYVVDVSTVQNMLRVQECRL